MAPFDRDDLGRLDWSMFQNGWVSLYHREGYLDEDCQWLSENGYTLYRCPCAAWSSKKQALQELGRVLHFPDYYGVNLDALNDCLSDVAVPDPGGVALILLRYDRFVAADPTTAHTILDILASASRSFMLFGQRFVTLVQTDDPQLSLDPVGSTPVMWNRREWLNKARESDG